MPDDTYNISMFRICHFPKNHLCQNSTLIHCLLCVLMASFMPFEYFLNMLRLFQKLGERGGYFHPEHVPFTFIIHLILVSGWQNQGVFQVLWKAQVNVVDGITGCTSTMFTGPFFNSTIVGNRMLPGWTSIYKTILEYYFDLLILMTTKFVILDF